MRPWGVVSTARVQKAYDFFFIQCNSNVRLDHTNNNHMCTQRYLYLSAAVSLKIECKFILKQFILLATPANTLGITSKTPWTTHACVLPYLRITCSIHVYLAHSTSDAKPKPESSVFTSTFSAYNQVENTHLIVPVTICCRRLPLICTEQT